MNNLGHRVSRLRVRGIKGLQTPEGIRIDTLLIRFVTELCDSACALHVVHEVECFSFVPCINLANYDIIIGCCMVVMFSFYYVDILIVSICITSCI